MLLQALDLGQERLGRLARLLVLLGVGQLVHRVDVALHGAQVAGGVDAGAGVLGLTQGRFTSMTSWGMVFAHPVDQGDHGHERLTNRSNVQAAIRAHLLSSSSNLTAFVGATLPQGVPEGQRERGVTYTRNEVNG